MCCIYVQHVIRLKKSNGNIIVCDAYGKSTEEENI